VFSHESRTTRCAAVQLDCADRTSLITVRVGRGWGDIVELLYNKWGT